jgi:hypothetical protein
MFIEAVFVEEGVRLDNIRATYYLFMILFA